MQLLCVCLFTKRLRGNRTKRSLKTELGPTTEYIAVRGLESRLKIRQITMTLNISVGDNDTSGTNIRWSEGFVSIAYYIIGSVGILGNLLVIIVVINFRAMRSKNINILALNQSMVDMIASAFIAASTRSDNHTYFEGAWGVFVCLFWTQDLTMWSLLMVSTINIVAITLERYIAIVHPIRYHNSSVRLKRQLTIMAIAIAWLVGCGFNVTITSATMVVRDHRCHAMVNFHSEAWQKTNGVAMFFFEFFLPFAICILCYIRIIWTLRHRVVPLGIAVVSSSHQGSDVNQTTTGVIINIHKTFGIVVLCAVLCNSCNQCLLLAYNFGYPLDVSGWLYNSSVIAAFANCCVNPFIYVFKYKMFQNGLKKLFYRNSSENTSAHATDS